MIIPPALLPIDTYHRSAPQWLSKTSLRDYVEHGPKWWKLAYLDRAITRPTPCGAAEGSALDCYLTEGAAVFAARYPVIPDDAPKRPDKRQREAKKPSPETIAAIKWWDEWTAAHPGAQPLDADDRAILADAVDAVRTHPCWPEIEACTAQQTVRRYSEGMGLGLQSRPDWLNVNRRHIYDLKKTRDLDLFDKQAINLGYHLQAAVAGWCLVDDGIALEHAYLVAVEWERGARCRVREIPHNILVAADTEMRNRAGEIAGRIASNDWNDTPGDVLPLEVPEYMLRKMEAA